MSCFLQLSAASKQFMNKKPSGFTNEHEVSQLSYSKIVMRPPAAKL